MMEPTNFLHGRQLSYSGSLVLSVILIAAVVHQSHKFLQLVLVRRIIIMGGYLHYCKNRTEFYKKNNILKLGRALTVIGWIVRLRAVHVEGG